MIEPPVLHEEPPLTRPVIVAPAPREVSFGQIRGRVGEGTVRVVVEADGDQVGVQQVAGRRFRLLVSLPPREVRVRVIAFDAAGNRRSSIVRRVFGLPAAAAPTGFKGGEDRALARKVRTLAGAYPGTAAVFVQDLTTGKGAAWNARARFPAASTVKLGIAIEVLRVLRGPPPARSWPVRRIRQMLVHSDNAASNQLLVWLGGSTTGGAARVNALLRRLGIDETNLYGGYALGTASGRPIPLRVESQPAFGFGKHTTAWDLARLHRYVHLATAGRGVLAAVPGITSADARYLLYTLAHVRDRGKLDRFIAGPRVTVAHKAGWISHARHDSGIVYWRGGAFVAVVMTWNGYRAGVSSDILAGRVAEAALRRFRAVRPASGRGPTHVVYHL